MRSCGNLMGELPRRCGAGAVNALGSKNWLDGLVGLNGSNFDGSNKLRNPPAGVLKFCTRVPPFQPTICPVLATVPRGVPLLYPRTVETVHPPTRAFTSGLEVPTSFPLPNGSSHAIADLITCVRSSGLMDL